METRVLNYFGPLPICSFIITISGPNCIRNKKSCQFADSTPKTLHNMHAGVLTLYIKVVALSLIHI